MAEDLQAKLQAMGYPLSEPAKAVGSYVPALRCGNLVLVSGQLPIRDGKLVYTGKVGQEVSLEDAQEACRLAVLNALAAAGQAAGSVDRLGRICRLAVFVNSAAGFTDQAKVANGASELLEAVFGEAGRHVRVAVGVAELPLNAAVELELWAECVG